MNTNRRHLLHLAALSTTAWAVPGHGLAAVTERSGSPDRKVTYKTFWNNTLSCDNAAVPVSQRSTRLAAVADFGSAQQCSMLKDSVEGPFYFCTNPGAADIARGLPGAPLTIALRAVDAATCQPIRDAVIDVWHCDTGGLYSGHNLAVDEAIKDPSHTPPVNGDRHCRGALRTDADGIAEFRSIYPGYYVVRQTNRQGGHGKTSRHCSGVSTLSERNFSSPRATSRRLRVTMASGWATINNGIGPTGRGSSP